MQRVNILAVKGGIQVVTGGVTSTTIVEGSFPSCTVSVFNTGTVNLATIFGDNLFPPTPKSNPFTADANGFAFFYAANGSRVDIQLSGTGIVTPFVVAADVLIDDGTLLTSTAPITVAFNATPTFDLSQASWFKMTLTGNVTVPVFSNPVIGQLLILSLTQNAAGGNTFAFPAAFLRPPAIALASNSVTELVFKYDGTNWTQLAASADNTSVPTQFLASTGTAALPSIALSASQTTGFFRQAADVLGASIAGVLRWLVNAAGLLFGSGQTIAWSSNADPSAAPGDSFLTRIGAAIWGLGSTNGGTDGEIRLAKVNKITVTQPATGATITVPDGTTQTFPSTSQTLVGRTSTDVLTNKTLTAPVINGTPTGTGIPTVTLKNGTGAGNYTTASTTFVRPDATNLAFTVTIPTGWKLLIAASGVISIATAANGVNVALADGSADNTGILISILAIPATTSVGQFMPFALNWVVNGDGASHTINLQFNAGNAADSAILVNNTATLKPVMTFLLTPSN